MKALVEGKLKGYQQRLQATHKQMDELAALAMRLSGAIAACEEVLEDLAAVDAQGAGKAIAVDEVEEVSDGQ